MFAVVIVIDAARVTRTESPCSSSQHRILPYIAFNKDAFPNRQRNAAGWTKSLSLPKLRFSHVNLQAQYQAFVRFAVTSSAALSAFALNRTWLLEPFTRAGSRLRTLASTRSIYGASNPGPTLWGGT
jgi:hypothetical protein